MPNRFTAQTVLMQPTQNSSIGSALLGQLGGSGGLASFAGASLGIKSPGDLYVALFHSHSVEDAIVKRFGLMARYHAKKNSQARQALETHSNVAVGLKDGLITVTVTDEDPKMAAEIANGYFDEYQNLSNNLAMTEASQRRKFFEKQLLEANENLAASEEAMKKTENTTGVFQIDSQTRALIESAASLRAQIVAKEVQLQGMSLYATQDNPDMLEARQQLVALQDQLAKLSSTGKPGNSGLIVPKDNVPEAELEYVRKLRDVKYYETISQLMARQYEIAKVDESHESTTLQVVDRAIPPDHKSAPSRTLIVILSTCVAFFLGCISCLLLEFFHQMNKDPEMVQRMNELRATFK